MNRWLASIVFINAVMAAVSGAGAADIGKGETLAKRWCAACHIVASDQTRANGQAPPFAAIAKTPDLDPSRLALFLLLPHPKMPDMNLSRAEAADIAAYIQSQGQ